MIKEEIPWHSMTNLKHDIKMFEQMCDSSCCNLSSLLLWEVSLTNIEIMWVLAWIPGVSYTEKGLPPFDGRKMNIYLYWIC